MIAHCIWAHRQVHTHWTGIRYGRLDRSIGHHEECGVWNCVLLLRLDRSFVIGVFEICVQQGSLSAGHAALLR
jgi:hypothetical protein